MTFSKTFQRVSLSLAVLSFALLSACASKPKIHAVYEEGIDFTQYKTFSFLDALEPSGQQYTSLVSKYLRNAITAELEARGMTENDDGEVLIGFHISTKEKITSHTTPTVNASYYGYRGRYGYSYGAGYGSETRISQYTEGTLNVDFVDRKQKQLVWEGVAIGRLKEKQTEDLEGDTNETIRMIFEKFPVALPL